MSNAQNQVLAVVDHNGASGLSATTRANLNTVHAGAARALVRAGVLVEFNGPDCSMVRRPSAEV